MDVSEKKKKKKTFFSFEDINKTRLKFRKRKEEKLILGKGQFPRNFLNHKKGCLFEKIVIFFCKAVTHEKHIK